MLPLSQQQRDLEWQRLLAEIGASEDKPTITRKSPDWTLGWNQGYSEGCLVGIQAERNGAAAFFESKPGKKT